MVKSTRATYRSTMTFSIPAYFRDIVAYISKDRVGVDDEFGLERDM